MLKHVQCSACIIDNLLQIALVMTGVIINWFGFNIDIPYNEDIATAASNNSIFIWGRGKYVGITLVY